MRKILSLSDLYNYFSSNVKENFHFNSEETGTEIVVQIDGNLKFDTDENKHLEGLRPVELMACHCGANVNHSSITNEDMTSALPSFSNRPILGYIHEVDGEPNFWSHNGHQEGDEWIADEIPVGIIPESCDARLEYVEEYDKWYVKVKGYLFSDYNKAVEIVEREKQCFVSVELSIRDLSFNAKTGLLEIKDFYFSGVTILGKTPEGEIVKPGMANSNVKLADFCAKEPIENQSDINEKLFDMLEKLNTTLSNFNNIKGDGIRQDDSILKNHAKEGEKGETPLNKLDELLEKYNKTIEDITFEIEGISDEELEAKFAEVFGEENDPEADSTVEPENEPENNGEGEGPGEPENEPEADPENEPEGTTIPVSQENSVNEPEADPVAEPAEPVSNAEKFTKTYELSHDDIRCALYGLLAAYEEADNDWYWIVATFSDHFVYQGCAGNYWGQKYTVENDSVAFEGERYVLYAEFVTESEKLELENMRSNYSSIVEQLNTYKANEINAEKETVINDESYAQFMDTEEFQSIVKDIEKYSVEELKTACELAFAKCVKKNGTFSAKVEDETSKKTREKVKVGVFSEVPEKDTADDPYGDYFKSIRK